MSSPISQALKQISEEKGIAPEAVMETLNAALAAAYRKDFGDKNQNLEVQYDPETGNMRVFDVKTVVTDELYEEWQKEQADREAARERGEVLPPPEKREEAIAGEEEKPRYHPKLNFSLVQAREIKPDAELGEVLRLELSVPGAFGRMAAQTAKQVIIQKLREAERNVVFDEYKSKEGQLISAVVQRHDGNLVLIDLGKATAVLPPDQQIMREDYRPGARVKVLLLSVESSTRGPMIRVSRTHPDIVRRLFEVEIPEVAAGTVTIGAIAREAGARTKVAVYSKESNIDPIGSCIGQRGTRIQTIINELGGEKVDIIEWSEDADSFIMHALSPAKVVSVKLEPDYRTAIVTVQPNQLSLAIGRAGQNVRLAAQLTGWKISVREEGGGVAPAEGEAAGAAESIPEVAAPTDGEATTEEAPPETTEEVAPTIDDEASQTEAVSEKQSE